MYRGAVLAAHLGNQQYNHASHKQNPQQPHWRHDLALPYTVYGHMLMRSF
jgi:hypothetical protein